MPKYASSKHTEEEYEEWLGRLDISIEAASDVELFTQELFNQINNLTDAGVTALWEAQQRENKLEEHGIIGLGTRENWGTQQRYAIQGIPGLWGFEAVQKIREGEGW